MADRYGKRFVDIGYLGQVADSAVALVFYRFGIRLFSGVGYGFEHSFHERRFSASVRPDHTDEIVRTDVEAHVALHFVPVVADRHMIQRNNFHGRAI